MTVNKRTWPRCCAAVLTVISLALTGCGAVYGAPADEIAGQSDSTVSVHSAALENADGKSAYDLAAEKGYTGDVQTWLAALTADDAYAAAVNHGYQGSEVDWLRSLCGRDGKSAYELVKASGYTGSEEEWMQSLRSEAEKSGASAYLLAVEKGYTGTAEQWLTVLIGPTGAAGQDGSSSAYDLAVANGFRGTLEAWLESLKEIWNHAPGTDEHDDSHVPEPSQPAETEAPSGETGPSDPEKTEPTEAVPTESKEELTVVREYINDQMHRILVMSDGSEVDMGSVLGDEQFTVEFRDRDGNVLKTELVVRGGNAVPPQAPEVEGYAFAGWSGSYENVTENRVLKATYIPVVSQKYTVKFVDHTGTVLSTQSVQKGAAAVAPDPTFREGYKFTGWDQEITDVQKDLTVTAQYQQLTGPAIQIKNAHASVGDQTVSVEIYVCNAPTMGALKMLIGFNQELTVQNVSFNSKLGSFVTTPEPYQNPLPLTLLGPLEPVDANGWFATITFAISDTVRDSLTTGLTVDCPQEDNYDFNMMDINFEVIPGRIYIEN